MWPPNPNAASPARKKRVRVGHPRQVWTLAVTRLASALISIALATSFVDAAAARPRSLAAKAPAKASRYAQTAGVASRRATPTKEAPTEASKGVLQVAGPETPLPAWIHWLGWSTDGTRFAVRQGPRGTGNRTGHPVWIARIDQSRRIVDRLYQRGRVRDALRKRTIARRGWRYCEQVGPADALIRTRNRQLFAVVLRGAPPVVAVLRRDHGTYRVLVTYPVRAPARMLKASGYETRDKRTIAILAQTGSGSSRQATLFVLPTRSPPAARPTKPRIATRAPTTPPVRPRVTSKRPSRLKRGRTRVPKSQQHPDEAHSPGSLRSDTSARTRQ